MATRFVDHREMMENKIRNAGFKIKKNQNSN
jgi:hypothetical protein